MKWIVVGILALSLVSCASINPKITKFDLENYEANKQMAKDGMKTWPLASGIIVGMGLTSPVQFPINDSSGLRPVLTNPAIILALTDLDDVCKRLGYWNEEDYWLGFSLGAKIRAGSQVAIQFVKDFFPELMKYAPVLFGL